MGHFRQSRSLLLPENAQPSSPSFSSSFSPSSSSSSSSSHKEREKEREREREKREGEVQASEMHQLVLSYLIHYCYSDTLSSFSRSIKSPIEPKLIEGMSSRKKIIDFILSGQIDLAFQEMEKGFPAVLKEPEVQFSLKTQKFIELIKSSDIFQALTYAQTELKLLGQSNEQFKKQLEDYIPLLAFPEPEKNPFSHLLSQERREEIAILINRHILSSENLPSEAPLEIMVAQISQLQKLLKNDQWSLRSFLSGREKGEEEEGEEVRSSADDDTPSDDMMSDL